MKRIKESGYLLVTSLILFLLSFNPTINGGIIGINLGGFSILKLLGLVFFIGALILFLSGKTLDVLIIPTGDGESDKVRTKRALKEWDKGYVKKIMISGELDKKESISKSQRYSIYKLLREHGIKPKDICVSGGKNSEENLKYSFRKLDKLGLRPNEIGTVSYPLHLDRFEKEFEKEKEKGEIPKNIKFHKIPTKQSKKDTIYGILANIKEDYHLEWANKFIGPIAKKISSYFK